MTRHRYKFSEDEIERIIEINGSTAWSCNPNNTLVIYSALSRNHKFPWIIRRHTADWLRANVIGNWLLLDGELGFDREEDLVLFKMRWEGASS